MKKLKVAAAIVSVVFSLQACVDLGLTEKLIGISPSSGSAQSLAGDWHSVSEGSFPTPDSCTDLSWSVTSQDATHMSGNFEATCDGGVTLTGTASGVLDGDLQFEATGTATGLGVSCPFTLTGTGALQADGTIRVDYTGQTCLGAISGTEFITR